MISKKNTVLFSQMETFLFFPLAILRNQINILRVFYLSQRKGITCYSCMNHSLHKLLRHPEETCRRISPKNPERIRPMNRVIQPWLIFTDLEESVLSFSGWRSRCIIVPPFLLRSDPPPSGFIWYSKRSMPAK